MKNYDSERWLRLADEYAEIVSGCTKVHVGSIIVREGRILGLGANRSLPNLCKSMGCLRMEKYGNNDKTHRGPGDCRAIHSEIDAICNSKADLTGATIFVTRYPCEGCARAIVAAGIGVVVYGRQQEISEETQRIFDSGHVHVVWAKDWEATDVTN